MTDLCLVFAGPRWLLNPFPAVSQTSTCKRWERLVSQNRARGRGARRTGQEGDTVSTHLWTWGRDRAPIASLRELKWGQHVYLPELLSSLFKTLLDCISLKYPIKFFPMWCPFFE